MYYSILLHQVCFINTPLFSIITIMCHYYILVTWQLGDVAQAQVVALAEGNQALESLC
jgi:hypothetical protein